MFYSRNLLSGKRNVAYGYAISNNKRNDIVACRGRVQPKGCYMINIKFKPTAIITSKTKYFRQTAC